MNKTELIAVVAEKAELSKKDAEKTVLPQSFVTTQTRQSRLSQMQYPRNWLRAERFSWLALVLLR